MKIGGGKGGEKVKRREKRKQTALSPSLTILIPSLYIAILNRGRKRRRRRGGQKGEK